jgi:prepilin-type N-terminal cleavage/methylation domain-containing protein
MTVRNRRARDATLVRRPDAGFTLVELLVTIVILGVITVPIANFVIGYFKNTAKTIGTLSESHDAQIAAAYWQQDVASIGTRSTTFNAASGVFPLLQSVNNASYPCALADTTQLVLFAWDNPDLAGDSTQTRVAYVTQVVGAGTQLVRLHCSNSSSPDTTTVLAHELVPGSVQAVCYAAMHEDISCSAAIGVPQEVDLSFAVKDPTDDGTYPVSLAGQRRQT